MAEYEKLLNFTESRNIAEDFDEERRKEIAKQVVTGYEIDMESRSSWLDINERAMDIVHQSGEIAQERSDPFKNAARVIFPLLSPAIIQSSARLVPHFRRNEVAVNFAVSGDDPMNLMGDRVKRCSKYTNWDLLVNSTWMLRNHKLSSILTSWGTVFRKTRYDERIDSVVDELLHPKEVIVNNNIQTLEQSNRITIISFFNQNDIVTQVNLGYFNSDFNSSDLKGKDNIENLKTMTYDHIENDSEDDQPVYEFLEQYCYLDLDEDGYYEPYIAWVHAPSETLLGLHAAYEPKDIQLSNQGQFIGIARRLQITDYHYIDDPDGNYYSIGLNHLLVNHNDACTAVLRNLLDSGTLANSQCGFVTKAVRTKQRDMRFDKIGTWKVLETAPDTDLTKAFFPLPTKDPSPVLFQLLGLLIDSGKEVGFITDILTGDTPAQNVPATTILALIEQGTRAFKPIVEKLYYSLSKEMKIRFELNQKVSDEKYQRFHNSQDVSAGQDFEVDSLDITPVADPSISSEAHKYAKLQALMQTMDFIPNKQALLQRFLKELEIENPDELLQPPPGPPQPDPKVMEAMANIQLKEQELKLKQAAEQRAMQETKIKEMQAKIKAMELEIRKGESASKIKKMQADAVKDEMDARLSERQVDIEEERNDIERDRIRSMEAIARDKASSSGN